MTKEEFLNKYADHLSKQQKEAVLTVEGPVLLLAVPGSGKTTVLVHRLGYMTEVAGVDPKHILTLTYTVAATEDMRRRFEGVFGKEAGEKLEFRTINGICSRIINEYGRRTGSPVRTLISEEDSIGKIFTEILRAHLEDYPTESDIKTVRTLITYCKNMMLSGDEIERLGEKARLPLLDIYKDYNRYLKDKGLMDYDDQMIYAYLYLKNSPELRILYHDMYRYICVDEAQDTSRIQHTIISMLAGGDGNLFMVGDEDQSIYGFRAAYPEALLNFEKDHPGAKVLVMDRNYRSQSKIVAAADRFIQHNKDRHAKHIVADRAGDADICYIDLKSRYNQYNYLLKVAADCRSETAVLYRDNESVIPLVDQLDRQGLGYRMKNGDMTFFTHRVVMDVTNIMQFAQNPCDTELFMRIYYKLNTYLTKKQAELLCSIAKHRNIPVLTAAEYAETINVAVLGRCKGLATNLRLMLKETPGKALFRIENPCGYGEYMERNGLDSNKLFIMKQLAENEDHIEGFLERLTYLQNMFKENETARNSKFILSTIHSAKGLEYDTVYMMDVFDGIFPVQAVKPGKRTTEEERQTMEEERRLFYVGITRAKNNLRIFRLSDTSSVFIQELGGEKKTHESKTSEKKLRHWVSDDRLIEGETVLSKHYGRGRVTELTEEQGKLTRFKVVFDDGKEGKFLFPDAFVSDMSLEIGKIEIREE